MNNCPCGSTLSLDVCCGVLHHGAPADTPEQLMRSRYSAFVLGLGEYLVHSWHPDYLNGLTATELSQTDTRWDGLEILASQGGPDDETEMVEFKAWFLEGDERYCLHERSRFVRYQGRWVYTDGEQDPAQPRVGRNDPCPCGSGKKFKKCCG
ncbi:YchJ family protein [Aeromonas enteropelogenes]|uniref:YchJ family protein n=1 Tax=Aeromonas enteropelogenes TaxID=29489 RepID=UPI00191EF7BF|nr:YchJ family protein [Aeromonas enteropelogenes]MBL0456683.1 YchJ family protein [Aeromonas enteropelogenes]